MGRVELIKKKKTKAHTDRDKGREIDTHAHTHTHTCACTHTPTHPANELDGVCGEPDGEEHLVVLDGHEEVILGRAVKGRLPSQHLVDEHAKRPPVHRGTIRLLLNNFGRNVCPKKNRVGGPKKNKQKKPADTSE